MGGNNSQEHPERLPQLTPEQRQRIAQCYQNGGLQTYEHGHEGFLLPRDMGSQAYEEVKYAEAAQKLGSAKNSQVAAASNDAYLLPKTIKLENGHGTKTLKFDYKITMNATVRVTFAAQPHKPDSYNPFDYESTAPVEVASRSYECDLNANGAQNTISFEFNPSDFSSFPMDKYTGSFFPCLLHIYAHYPHGTQKQNENFIYLSFGYGMNSFNIERNVLRKDGKSYELKTVYGLAGDSQDDSDNVCLVCLENKKNIILKPCSHLCICDVCAEPMLKTGQRCPVCRSKIEEIEKISM